MEHIVPFRLMGATKVQVIPPAGAAVREIELVTLWSVEPIYLFFGRLEENSAISSATADKPGYDLASPAGQGKATLRVSNPPALTVMTEADGYGFVKFKTDPDADD